MILHSSQLQPQTPRLYAQTMSPTIQQYPGLDLSIQNQSMNLLGTHLHPPRRMNSSKFIFNSLLAITLSLLQFLSLILLSALFIEFVVFHFDLFVAISAFAPSASSVN